MSKIAKLIRATNRGNDEAWEGEWDWDELKSVHDRTLKEELARLKADHELASLQRDIDTIKHELAKRAEIKQWERDRAAERAKAAAVKAAANVVPIKNGHDPSTLQ